MAKKKKQQQDVPVKQPEFHTSPFKVLKEVALKVAPEKQQKKETPPPPPPPVQKPDESILFLEAMQGVKKLAAEQAAVKAPAPKPKASTKEKTPEPTINVVDTEVFTQAISQLKLDVTFEDKIPEDEDLKPLAVNRLRQLKKGVINVDRQLDLHGLTREEALAAMPRFLQNARAHGEKAVLIITGKGNNSPGEPVLQQAVTGWLRLQGKGHVLEFAPAPKEMGGSGAFVVFLRGMDV